jgi:hypothetical protein
MHSMVAIADRAQTIPFTPAPRARGQRGRSGWSRSFCGKPSDKRPFERPSPSQQSRSGSCSRDPVGYRGSRWSLYEYVGGRPSVSLDPTGHIKVIVPGSDPLMPGNQQPPPKPLPAPGSGKNKKRPFPFEGYLCTYFCTPKEDRLSPIPGVSNPSTSPIPGTGPSGGHNQIYPFPTNPPSAVGTGGCEACIALIVKCPSFVAVYHFTPGDAPLGTLGQYSWPSGCEAIICGGNSDPQSNCLGDDVMGAAKNKGLRVVGVSGNSACGVDADGNWWQHGS